MCKGGSSKGQQQEDKTNQLCGSLASLTNLQTKLIMFGYFSFGMVLVALY